MTTQAISFRNFIKNEPDAKFPPEKGRYHLYVAWGCPWAHGTLIVRALKGLEDIIGVSLADDLVDGKGWKFDKPEEVPENPQYISEIYYKADPNFNGRFTVPVLWDKKLKTIVNNESAEIIRMFNDAFDDLVPEKKGLTFYPEHLRTQIDENKWTWSTVSQGIYKSGFATTQEEYDEGILPLFNSLDRVEEILSKKKFLVEDTFTEADIRLWPFIVRFDPIYHTFFKCNLKSIEHNYPHILNWARRIYQTPTIVSTLNIQLAKKLYYRASKNNPNGIVPIGNGPDLGLPVVNP